MTMSNIQEQISSEELAGCIDHTLLAATATSEQIKRICREGIEYGFCCVFVNPRWVGLAAEALRGTGVKVGSVAGFPLGADSTKIKVAQAKEVLLAGADEVDMVADLAAIIQADERYLTKQLAAVLKMCRSMESGVILKVIIEAAALSKEQKIFACQICQRLGVDFIKTSTGFHPTGGATVEDVKLMKEIAPGCKIKAAGGIRTAKQALDMIAAGADRIGASASVQIIEQFRAGEL